MFLGIVTTQAQIVIGGSVYGGGNAGDLGGRTTVNIYAGDIHEVYGGARQANVGGSAFLHIDGEHASSYVVIDKVYGVFRPMFDNFESYVSILYNKWVIVLLIAAVLEMYTMHRIEHELNNEKKHQ